MNVDKIRKDFPILASKRPPIYFDNACTTFKPVQVMEKMQEYYTDYPTCAGRSHHRLGKKATEEVFKARKTVADFFGAKKESEIVFTRNTTEGINLIANATRWKAGDAVLCSDKEHNSNMVPWLRMSQNKIIKRDLFRFGDIDDFSRKVKGHRLVSIVQTSNVDGTSQDIQSMIKIAHDAGSKVLLDAAQSAPHKPIDVKKLDVDYLVCSGHKMLGPSGTGILYGKQEALAELDQFMVGGDTVKNTTYDSFEPEDIPEYFEAGLQNYSGMVGLAEACRYLKKVGLADIADHEKRLNLMATKALLDCGAEIIGPKDAMQRSGVASFNFKGVDYHNIAIMLDSYNIMIRSGMHCVHSWFNANKLLGSARASFYLYNTGEEVAEFNRRVADIAKLAR